MTLEIQDGGEIRHAIEFHGIVVTEIKKKWVSLKSLKEWVKKFRSSSGSEVEEYTWAELTKELEGF